MASPNVIGDHEIIYRRIPVSQGWYDPDKCEVKPEAFKPLVQDTTGLSVSRVKSSDNPDFLEVEEIAHGKSPQGYYVASLLVSELRANGIDVVAKPTPDNPGHAEIPTLVYENRKSETSQSNMVLMAHRLVKNVLGPFTVERPPVA